MKSRPRFSFLLALLAAIPSVASAASGTWSATPHDANWIPDSTFSNWSTGADAFPGSTSVLTSTDIATFNSGSTSTSIGINNSALNLGSVTFDTSAVAYTIGATGGNPLLLSSGGMIQIPATFTGTSLTETINAPIVLEPTTTSSAGTYTFTNNSATATNSLTFGGAITGGTTSAGITLNLNGANTNNTTFNLISGAVTAGGATGGVTIAKAGAGTWKLSNALTDAYLNGSVYGTLWLDGGKLTTTTTLTMGTTSSGRINLGTTTAGTLVVSGATSDLNVGGGTSGFTGTLEVNNGSTVTVGRNLRVGGDGSTANTRNSGLMTVNNGTVTVAGSMLVQNSGDGGVYSDTLNVYGGTMTGNSLQINMQREKGHPISVNVKTAGTLEATTGVTFTSAGTSTVNTTATLTVDAGGTLRTSAITGRANTTRGFFVLALTGGKIVALADNTSFMPANFTNAPIIGSSGITFDTNSKNITIAQALAGASGKLTKDGLGTLTLGGTNTFSGNTKVTGGTLVLTNPLALQNSAIDTSGAGVIDITGITSPTFGGLIGSVNLGSVITAGYGNITRLTLNPGTGANNTYSGTIADNTAGGMTFTKSGNGTQVLSGSILYTGATTISGGTLALSGSASIPASPFVEIDTGATLDMSALGGTWSIPSTQTLKGSGTLIGNATTAGKVTHGLFPGTLSVTGDFTFASDSSYDAEIIDGISQVETATAAGTAVGSTGDPTGGFVKATITGAGLIATVAGSGVAGGSPFSWIWILAGDTPDVWADKVRIELAKNIDITTLYTVGGSGASITLTRIIPAANDTTLNIALTNDTAYNPSIIAAATSANTTAGAPGGNDRLAVSGALDVSGATLNLTGTLTAPAYVIATYGTLTGTFAHITGMPGDYSMDYAYSGNKIAIKKIITPPAWAVDYPAIDSITTTGFTVHAQINKTGKAWYVVLAAGTSPPTSADVKAGTPSLKNGSIDLTANTPGTSDVTGLVPGTAYDVWFAAEDTVPNLQATPTSVPITTQSALEAWIAPFPVGTLKGPADDPDGDGQNNLMEFALDGTPSNGALNGKVYSHTGPAPEHTGDVLILTLAVRDNTEFTSATAANVADGIRYTVEGGANLNTWTGSIYPFIASSYADLPAPGTGYHYQSFALSDSAGLPGKGFLRVRVEPLR